MTPASSSGPAGVSDGDAARAERASTHAESYARGEARFVEFVRAVRTLVAMLNAYRRGDFPMTWREAAALLAALLYVVNPADAMPEAMLGPAGLPDDAAAIAVVVGALSAAIMRYRRQPAPSPSTRVGRP